jgi:hypothetical protein
MSHLFVRIIYFRQYGPEHMIICTTDSTICHYVSDTFYVGRFNTDGSDCITLTAKLKSPFPYIANKNDKFQIIDLTNVARGMIEFGPNTYKIENCFKYSIDRIITPEQIIQNELYEYLKQKILTENSGKIIPYVWPDAMPPCPLL